MWEKFFISSAGVCRAGWSTLTTAVRRIWTWWRRSWSWTALCCWSEPGTSALQSRLGSVLWPKRIKTGRKTSNNQRTFSVWNWARLMPQVENAASRGASAVLIYPDVEDFNLNDDVELYGHVSPGSSVETQRNASFPERFSSVLRFTWAQEIPTLQDFPPSTTPSSPQPDPLASPRSWHRLYLPKRPNLFLSKTEAASLTDC